MSNAIYRTDDYEKKKDSPFIKLVKAIVMKILLYFPLIFWSAVTLFPFYYMMIMSTKSTSQIYSFPPPLFFLSDAYQNLLLNYQHLLDQIPFWRNMWNSLFVATMSTAMVLFFCSLGGYGFGMYEFKGKKALFTFMLFTLMIPGMLTIIPFFAMMVAFGWINNPIALIIPGAASAYGMFMMRQFVISSVPKDLVEAARIDGSSEWGIYFRIVIPMIKPALGSFGIITFIGSWNNFMVPLIIMTDKETMTIPVALNTLRGFASVDWGAVMLGSSISVLPISIVFIIFSRWIITSVTEGAIRE